MNENVFRLLPKICDKHCKSLTRLSYQKCLYDKDQHNNIIKISSDKCIVEWETIVYLYLMDKNITPLVSISNMTIEYKTNDKISLYEYIRTNKMHIKLILNELMGFIAKFRKCAFLHGNLHIYNILVDTKKFPGIFYIIDLGNSFLYSCKIQPRYKRSSFLGETNLKSNTILSEYWDFFTLYVSLKPILDSQYFFYFENLIRNYVKEDILNNFLIEYEMYIKDKMIKCKMV